MTHGSPSASGLVTGVHQGADAGPVSPRAATRLAPLPLGAVTLTDGFLGRLQRDNATTSIVRGQDHLVESGAWTNFENAAARRQGQTYHGPVFEDGEVFKWMEAAAWEHGRSRDERIGSWLTDHIDLIARAQEEDGYLSTFIQVTRKRERYEWISYDHEIFDMATLIQAAVARFRSSGATDLLAVAVAAADHLDATFGEDGRRETCGHPLVEMALVELYRVTGERRYLDLASFFVEVRGHGTLTDPTRPGRAGRRRTSATGCRSGRPGTRRATPSGPSISPRAPRTSPSRPATPPCSTRCAVSGTTWSRPRPTSTAASGRGGRASRSATPTSSPTTGATGRPAPPSPASSGAGASSWPPASPGTPISSSVSSTTRCSRASPSTATATSTSTRSRSTTAPSPTTTAWPRRAGRSGSAAPAAPPTSCGRSPPCTTTDPGGTQIHQYGSAEITSDHGDLIVRTDYPWHGDVEISVTSTSQAPWELALRIPAWAEGATLQVARADPVAVPAGTYARTRRTWEVGDVVRLRLPMAPRTCAGHHRVDPVRGSVAIERGPLLYAVEQIDQPTGLQVDDLALVGELRDGWSEVLGGIPVVTAAARNLPDGDQHDLVAIPYFMWANRDVGPMKVWIPLQG